MSIVNVNLDNICKIPMKHGMLYMPRFGIFIISILK